MVSPLTKMPAYGWRGSDYTTNWVTAAQEILVCAAVFLFANKPTHQTMCPVHMRSVFLPVTVDIRA